MFTFEITDAGESGRSFKGLDDDVVHKIYSAVREESQEAVSTVIEYNLTII